MFAAGRKQREGCGVYFSPNGELLASTSGDMADWENIDPGPDGTFTVNSYQYTGTVPGGSSSGIKGYGMTGFRLEEFNVLPVGVGIYHIWFEVQRWKDSDFPIIKVNAGSDDD